MKNISRFMKRQVISIAVSATINEAATLFVEHHIGTLPVVDADKKLAGILHMRDLLELVMPDFVGLVDDFYFVRGDFGVFETLRPSPETAVQSVRSVMTPPISVRATCGLLRAFAIINSHDLYDISVVDNDNQLVGLASRVDIGAALLAGWRTVGVESEP